MRRSAPACLPARVRRQRCWSSPRWCGLASCWKWKRSPRRQSEPANAQRPGQSQGATQHEQSCRLQPIEDLVGPEPLEPVQRLVEGRELLGIDAADLLDRANVLLVKP